MVMENKYKDAHRFANRWDLGICEQDQHYENKCVAMYCRVHTCSIKDNDGFLQDGAWSPWSSWSSCSPRQVNSINKHHSHIDANQPAAQVTIPDAHIVRFQVHLGAHIIIHRCTHHRRRTCTDPHPSPGGSYCRGRDQVGGGLTI